MRFFLFIIFFHSLSASEFAANQLLLWLKPVSKPLEILRNFGVKSFESLELLELTDKNFFQRPLVITFDGMPSLVDKLNFLKKQEFVIAAQLNIKYTMQSGNIPDDPYFKHQWEHRKFPITSIWKETSDCGRKIIAVLDTGISFAHIDLSSNYSHLKYNTLDPEKDPEDFNGHGTLIASIIGARGGNGQGVSGVCWTAKIMPIKVLNELGEGYSSHIIQGLTYAQKNKASILNLGFGSYQGEDIFLKRTLEQSINSGILAVAPAGNDGVDIDKKPFWPCSFRLKGLICVGSISPSGELANFSNFGKNTVNIGAPGEDIFGVAPGSIKAFEDNLEDGWNFSENSGIQGKAIGLPLDPYEESSTEWAEKDFAAVTDNKDFSYLQFSVKIRGSAYLSINGSTHIINGNQQDFFMDLKGCKNQKKCVVKFFTNNSRLEVYRLKILNLKIANKSYQIKFGTSLSSAYVSGMAGLVGSFNLNFKSKNVFKSLIEGAKSSPNLTRKIRGGKIIDPISQFKFLAAPKW